MADKNKEPMKPSLPAQVVGTEIAVPLAMIDGDWKHNLSRQFLNEEHAKAALAAMDETADFKELVRSIKEQGQLNPLIVRPIKDAEKPYRLVAGFRRFRALQKLESPSANVKVAEIDEQRSDELNLIENVVRKTVNRFELATAAMHFYRKHKKPDGKPYTSEEVGKRFGLTPVYVRSLVMCREKLCDEILIAWAMRDEDKDFAIYKATAYPLLQQYSMTDKNAQPAAFHFQILLAQNKTEEEAQKILAEGGFTFPTPKQKRGGGGAGTAKGIKRDFALDCNKALRAIREKAEPKTKDRIDAALAYVNFLLGMKGHKNFHVGKEVIYDPNPKSKGDVEQDNG